MKKQTWREYLEDGGFAQCCECNHQLVIEVVDDRDTPVCMRCSCVEYGYMEHEAGFVQALQRRMHVSDHWMIRDVLDIARMHVRELAQCEQCKPGITRAWKTKCGIETT